MSFIQRVGTLVKFFITNDASLSIVVNINFIRDFNW